MDWWAELFRLMRTRPAPRAEGVVVPFARPRENAASGRDVSFTAPFAAPADSRRAESAAREIAAGLADLAARADAAGLPLLAYLIDCAALEAGKEPRRRER